MVAVEPNSEHESSIGLDETVSVLMIVVVGVARLVTLKLWL